MGRERRVHMWAAIEAEMGEPLADTIMGLRELGNSWRTVAGALGCSLATLQEWRKALRLPLDQNDKRRDPSSTLELTPCDRRAIASGYENMVDAVLDLRVKHRKTLREAATVLGVHPVTVGVYTPEESKGLRGSSEAGRAVHRAQCVEMTRRSRAKHRDYPWKRGDDRMYRERKTAKASE